MSYINASWRYKSLFKKEAWSFQVIRILVHLSIPTWRIWCLVLSRIVSQIGINDRIYELNSLWLGAIISLNSSNTSFTLLSKQCTIRCFRRWSPWKLSWLNWIMCAPPGDCQWNLFWHSPLFRWRREKEVSILSLFQTQRQSDVCSGQNH